MSNKAEEKKRLERKRSALERAEVYAKRVVPEAKYTPGDGHCLCSQCAARRGWLAGFKAGKRA